ncbi:MAG TPA: TRAP transporter substrate-binding protein [Candidatus Oscillibacter pullicola]|nr:TRAP transporter substrate-binding protein [Candidatus Oscillibacter pullicola]
MKKFLATILAVLMTASLLAGCGGGTPSADSSGSGGESSSGETYTFSIGMNSVEGDIPYYLADYFKQAIEEKSNGAVTVDLYPGGQMGGDSELIENVMAGALDFYSGNVSNTTPYVTAAAVMDSYWDFDDLEHFRRFLDSEFMDVLNSEYEKVGMRISSVAEVGMRQLMSNKKIETVADMAGLKIRVMQNKYQLAAWEALGAAPTPMDWGEVYVGLQQKMIDAVEQPYFFICSSKLYEVQDYMLMTNHQPQPAVLLMSDDVYQGLPEDIQALVDECAEIAKEKTRETCDNMMEEKLQEIIDNGVEVVEPTAEALEEMRQAVASANALIAEDVGEEFYSQYTSYRDSTR